MGPGIACNNDGVWNDVGAILDFSVAPAWYQTNWFIVVCLFAGLLVLITAYRLRVRQIARAMSARFDERLAERTRVAREIHDTFLQTVQGSKMVADHALKYSADHARMVRAMEQLSTWLEQATEDRLFVMKSTGLVTRRFEIPVRTQAGTDWR